MPINTTSGILFAIPTSPVCPPLSTKTNLELNPAPRASVNNPPRAFGVRGVFWKGCDIMKWLTVPKIEAAAHDSPHAAARASADHWRQIIVGGPEKYWQAHYDGLVSTKSKYCALCERYLRFNMVTGEWEARSCFLRRNCAIGSIATCCPEHGAAQNAVDTTKTGKRWPAKARRAIQALIDKIESKINH